MNINFQSHKDHNLEEFPLEPDDSAQRLADDVHAATNYQRHQQKTIIEVLRYGKSPKEW